MFEAFDELWDNFVDREDDFYDADGVRWMAIDGDLGPNRNAGVIFNQVQLAEIRCQCRALAAGNAFAVNGHENRINYIVGSGHSYRVLAQARRPGRRAPAGRSAGRAWTSSSAPNKWHKRQQEIVRRKDRDGECFLRLFPADRRH